MRPKLERPEGANAYFKSTAVSIWCEVYPFSRTVDLIEQFQIRTYSTKRKKWSEGKRWVNATKIQFVGAQ